jgi:3-hydroxyisobutyrate dehydrogenase
MGVPMARDIARAGFDLTLWNRTEAKARALADQLGCGAAPTPRILAERVDVVITMLADDASSEAVHTGPEGIFAAGGPRCVVAMGRLSPDHYARLTRAAPAGVTIVDAPVSGATQAAEDAQLLIMAAAPSRRPRRSCRRLGPWANARSFWATPGPGRS